MACMAVIKLAVSHLKSLKIAETFDIVVFYSKELASYAAVESQPIIICIHFFKSKMCKKKSLFFPKRAI